MVVWKLIYIKISPKVDMRSHCQVAMRDAHNVSSTSCFKLEPILWSPLFATSIILFPNYSFLPSSSVCPPPYASSAHWCDIVIHHTLHHVFISTNPLWSQVCIFCSSAVEALPDHLWHLVFNTGMVKPMVLPKRVMQVRVQFSFLAHRGTPLSVPAVLPVCMGKFR